MASRFSLRTSGRRPSEVEALVASSVSSDEFTLEYGRIFAGDEKWRSMPAPTGLLFDWDTKSTYVREPPYFHRIFRNTRPPLADIKGARVLALLGDSITTDHISPAGSITVDSPAGQYLVEHAVTAADFNSFGSRRGNHEVMIRGTFGNIRLHNLMVPGKEGPWTRHVPSGEHDEHLRRRHAISARADALGGGRGQGIRIRQFARLGGQRVRVARH